MRSCQITIIWLYLLINNESKKQSDLDIINRWHQLYNGTALTQKYVKGENLSNIEMDLVQVRLSRHTE